MNVKTQEIRNAEKETAQAMMETIKPTVIADYGRLQLYRYDYHWLMSRWLIANQVVVEDCDVEFYPTYALVGDTIFPYDVRDVDTEQEALLMWIGAGRI